MSHIKNKARFLLIAVVALFSIIATGCSDSNKKGVFDTDTGKHPENWYTEHSAAYTADPNVCHECHGTDLLGGTSSVSCYSASFDGQSCHANGPEGHPSGWSNPSSHGASAKAAPNVATTSGFSTCQSCHGTDFTGGVVNQSCFTCHGVNAPHASSPWKGTLGSPTHVTTDEANVPVCAQCHLSSGPASAAGCFNNTLCHAAPTQCTLCHTKPPSGSAAPNRAGAHAAHDALANVTGVCGTCHNGAGIGTSNHQNGMVEVLFLSAYSAKTGTAIHNNDGTCSNVSCHGGQKTPVWLSGTVDVNAQCAWCHAFGTAEYNSFFSGQHDAHVNGEGFACTQCHDTAKLTVNHVNYLNTSTMEGPASATINDSFGYDGVSCSPGCHETRAWQ